MNAPSALAALSRTVDSLHGDEHLQSDLPASLLERALLEIVDTVMTFGEYPAHSTKANRQYDLRDRFDNVPIADTLDEYIAVLTDWSGEQLNRQRRYLEIRLREELRESELVRAKAIEMRDAAAEEAASRG